MNFDEPRIILTRNLREADLPTGRINWSKFSNFSLTFDPRLESLTEEQLREIAEMQPRADHNIQVLRAFLYNWQRIWNNKTYEAPQDFYQKMGEVIEWIRGKILS